MNLFSVPRGARGAEEAKGKALFLCAVSLYTNRKGQEKPGFAHMQVVDNASADTVEEFLDRLGCGDSTNEGKQLVETIRSYGWRSYGKAAKNKDLQHLKVVLRDPKVAGKILPCVHRVISNVKSVIRGSHRGVSEKHLQAYLSEVCYSFNRRFWEKELFDRLLQACIVTETLTYKELIYINKRL